jgi:hypothetical protein
MSVIALGIAVVAGVLLGALVKPASWRLVSGLLGLGLVFFVFELVRASRLVPSMADLVQVITLAGLSRYWGAMVIAYAAFLAAAVMALRISFSRRRPSHEA